MSYLLAAAIDFGTTFSGWAFSFKHDFERDPIKITAKNWHGDQLISAKAPTCVLIKPDGKTFDSFGYTAESRYANLVGAKQHKNWYFFRRFKMMLFDKIKISRNAYIEDVCGKKLSANKVFSMVIRFLKDDVLEECNKELGDALNENDIKWVLTVPAIWNDAAKQFMREAAIEAGIKKEHLLIALEPEAASIFCRHLPIDKDKGAEQISLASMKAGTKYIVVDAGGGTVDITFHQVIIDDKLREIHKASGGAWGGTRIDVEYEGFLSSLLEPDIIKKFHDEHLEDYTDMMRAFEIKKRDIKPRKTHIKQNDESKVTIRMPASLIELVFESRGKPIKDIIADSSYTGRVLYESGKIRVEAEILRLFFKETVEQITGHIRSLLREKICHECSTIVLAGGFAESCMLQEAIRDAFDGFRVIVPGGAGLAVLKGAVIFGHRPATIEERVCRYTYGLKTSHRSSEACNHPPTEITTGKDGIKRCKNLFDINARCGETVKLTEERPTKKGTPRYDDQTKIIYTIFASENDNPLLTTEEKCFELGRLTIPILDISLGKQRSFEKSFIFGGTELVVKVVDQISKEEYVLSVDCLD